MATDMTALPTAAEFAEWLARWQPAKITDGETIHRLRPDTVRDPRTGCLFDLPAGVSVLGAYYQCAGLDTAGLDDDYAAINRLGREHWLCTSVHTARGTRTPIGCVLSDVADFTDTRWQPVISVLEDFTRFGAGHVYDVATYADQLPAPS